MADNSDRTEEATPERREEFRERGQVVNSREVTSVFVLAASAMFAGFYFPKLLESCERFLVTSWQRAAYAKITPENVMQVASQSWVTWLTLTLPFFALTFVIASALTFAQTRLNWSWEKLKPDFSRLNPGPGLVRMVNTQALVELGKGIGKMFAVGTVAYLILHSEWVRVPSLMHYPVVKTWAYWADITETLFYSVAGFMVFIAGLDWVYSFVTLEGKLKMTKQEVKEEYKKREVDPQVKGRMRKLARDYAMSKMLAATKEATVVVTNPTHFAVALKYEMGMGAPIVVAKAVDFNALRIREVAKDFDVPIIENKPLARTLYKICEVGQEIPESLYKAVSEVIRYVFKLKGRRVTR